MHRPIQTYRPFGDGRREAWQDHPGVIARPPWIVAAFLAVGFAIDRLVPAPLMETPVQYAGGAAAVVAGLALIVAAMRAFRRAGTPVETWRPTARIVTSGPYAGMRNPIYAGMLLAFVGVGMLADAPAVIALAPALFAVLHFGVVLREEHYLEHKFGDAWLDYRRTVGRWL